MKPVREKIVCLIGAFFLCALALLMFVVSFVLLALVEKEESRLNEDEKK